MANQRDVDALVKFMEFVEVVSKPEALKAWMDEQRALLDAQEKANGIHRELESVKEAKRVQDEQFEKELERLSKKEEAFDAKVVSFDRDMVAIRLSISEQLKALGVREVAVTEREDKVAKLEKDVGERMDKSVEKEDQLNRRAIVLAQLQKELEDKAAALKNILG